MKFRQLLFFSLISTSLTLASGAVANDVAARQYGGGGGGGGGYGHGGGYDDDNDDDDDDDDRPTSTGTVLLPQPSGIAGSAVTGDSQCGPSMCVSATVNGSNIQYVLSTTRQVGWMAMGFGTSMTDSAIVLMWSNADGSITLSQRKASGRTMPTVDGNPPRVAALSSGASSVSSTSTNLAFVVPANGDTRQNVVYAFSQSRPSSAAVDASINQHSDQGSFQLDLAKTITASPGSGNAPSTAPSGEIPLTPTQKLIVAHAIFCVLGFLVLLPAGALLARYFRTFTPTWFKGHWITQFVISGPVIMIGFVLGVTAVGQGSGLHVNDRHKAWGVTIFVLYLVQCSFGAVIHFVKDKNRTKRPPQNYGHAILGLLIIALALFQVRTGYREEWPKATGRDVPNGANAVWYVWVVMLPLFYFGGLAFLPKQMNQERRNRVAALSTQADRMGERR